jgi:hypothetical protein
MKSSKNTNAIFAKRVLALKDLSQNTLKLCMKGRSHLNVIYVVRCLDKRKALEGTLIIYILNEMFLIPSL